MKKLVLLSMVMLLLLPALMAQQEHHYKNTVRFNLTNPLIFGGKSLIFGYERILQGNQSFSINIGQASFQKLGLISTDSLKNNENLGQSGLNISVDYRFYLLRENKYDPPRGVYIGPYYSYNNFQRTNAWSLKSTEGGATKSVESKINLSAHTVGFEMGYQFIFWNRMTLDLVLAGPGIAAYKLKASLNTNLSEEDKQKFFDSLNQALEDKFPGYNRVIDEGEFQQKGSSSSTRLGYRYMAMLGYRF